MNLRRTVFTLRLATAAFCAAFALPASADAPPAPWVGADIGAVIHKGYAELKDGGITLNGSGSDLYGSADSAYFLGQPLKGDGTLVAHFTKGLQYVDGWAKAGLMIRESTDPGAPNAFLTLTSQHGAAFQTRSTPGGETAAAGIDGNFSTAAGGKGEWLKLERIGSRITGFLSLDGKVWTRAGEGRVPMKAAVLAGLCMTAHDPNQQYGFAAFDSIALTPGTPKTAPGPAPKPVPQGARRADDFVDTIGVNAHFNYGGVYGDFAKASAQLGALGVRHLRFAATDPTSISQINTLYAKYGIRDLFGTGTSSGIPLAELTTIMGKLPGAVEAVEGPNEIDIKQWDDATHGFNKWFSYKGLTNSDGNLGASRQYVTDIYDTFRASPTLKTILVGSPSVAFPENSKGLAPLTKVDMLTMHSYAGGGLPSDQLDTRWIPNTLKMTGDGGPVRPIWSTECGYHNAVQGAHSQPGISEATGAKYFPRLFAEYFNRGIARAYTYELYDQGTDLSNQEQNFGLVRHDYTPKPAYVAEKNLIALLGESKWDTAAKAWHKRPFTPGSLTFALSGDIADVRHTLLQKADGDFYLLLWQDVFSFDRGTKKDIANPPVAVTLTLGQAVKRAATYLPSQGVTATLLPVTSRALKLSVPDEVLIVKLTPG
jgi:hypothetical protein